MWQHDGIDKKPQVYSLLIYYAPFHIQTEHIWCSYLLF